jgi:hypothetical protein
VADLAAVVLTARVGQEHRVKDLKVAMALVALLVAAAAGSLRRVAMEHQAAMAALAVLVLLHHFLELVYFMQVAAVVGLTLTVAQ